MDEPELTDLDATVLNAVGAVCDDSGWTDTEQASAAVRDELVAVGSGGPLTGSGPWFGLRTEIEHLQALGLLEIDPGVASFHRSDDPSPTVDLHFLGLTDRGRSFLARPEGTG